MLWPPEKIRSLRNMYGESQNVFCRRLGVTADALQHWEQGRGAPNGSALLLMDRLEEDFLAGKIRELQMS